MSILGGIVYKELVKKLKSAGFIYDRQAKGSHEIWYNPEKNLRTTIPNHPGEIKKGTIKAIINQMNLTNKEFIKL